MSQKILTEFTRIGENFLAYKMIYFSFQKNTENPNIFREQKLCRILDEPDLLVY